MKTRIFATACAIACISLTGWADDAPKFQNLRFTEDWSNFDASASDHWSAPLKKIEISDSVWISVGGEQRIRYEDWSNFGFGEANDDSFTLFRSQVHTDIHIGDTWRLFLEGRMTTLNNRDLPGEKRAALDIDEGDFGNAFIDKTFNRYDTDMTLRLGRQELQFGKQRLISPLDWANNRRLFDGGVLAVQGDGYTAHFIAVSPVTVDPDELALNDTNDDTLLWGFHYTRGLSEKTNMDAYAYTRNARHGTGNEEDRYTIGGRYFGHYNDAISFDTEMAYQFGEQDDTDMDISAWMFTAEVTYAFIDVAWKPAVTLGLDYATGDDDPSDDDIETFSHLFPLAHAYLGFTDLVGRQNIIDYRLTVAATPMPKVLLRGDIHLLQLESKDDGLYSVAGSAARPAADEDDLGVAYDAIVKYTISKHQDILIGYSHFEAGDYIEDTGADEDFDFFYLQWGYTF
jgi:hypothetical protein